MAVLIAPRNRAVQEVELDTHPDLPTHIDIEPGKFLMLDQASIFDKTIAPFIFEGHGQVLLGTTLAFGFTVEEVLARITWVSTLMVCNGSISVLHAPKG